MDDIRSWTTGTDRREDRRRHPDILLKVGIDLEDILLMEDMYLRMVDTVLRADTAVDKHLQVPLDRWVRILSHVCDGCSHGYHDRVCLPHHIS